MDEEQEKPHSPVVEETKRMVRKKRKRRKRRRSIWSMVKRGTIWGIAIGIALLAIIFAVISYNW